MLPKFRLADGTELIATSFIKNIRSDRKGASHRVTYEQAELNKVGAAAPVRDSRMSVKTEYRFAPGSITRTDTYTPRGPLAIDAATLEFASFSSAATMSGLRIRFGEGKVSAFEVRGLKDCQVAPTAGDDRYKSPNGPMHSIVRCSTPAFTMQRPMVIEWVMHYREASPVPIQ